MVFLLTEVNDILENLEKYESFRTLTDLEEAQ